MKAIFFMLAIGFMVLAMLYDITNQDLPHAQFLITTAIFWLIAGLYK